MEKLSSQCKNCGGELTFNPTKQTLSCEYCETSYHLPKAKIDAVLVRGYSNGFHPNQLNKSLNCYQCEMCGHTYFTALEEKSKECPDCGNPSCKIIKSSGYCADGIIPFEISKEEAAEKFKAYLKSKPAIPKELMKEANNQNLQGVFIPVWNFIFDVNATYNATANELKTDENGNYYGVPFPIFGSKTEQIKSADQSATSSEQDEFLEIFDEKDYEKIIPYAPEYTFGYKVDNIDRNIKDFYTETTNFAESKFKRKLTDKVFSKYKDVSNYQINVESSDVYFNFTYVPVYINSYRHKGKVYKTYISGTTGRVVGKRPISIKSLLKFAAKFLGLMAAVAALSYFLFF